MFWQQHFFGLQHQSWNQYLEVHILFSFSLDSVGSGFTINQASVKLGGKSYIVTPKIPAVR